MGAAYGCSEWVQFLGRGQKGAAPATRGVRASRSARQPGRAAGETGAARAAPSRARARLRSSSMTVLLSL